MIMKRLLACLLICLVPLAAMAEAEPTGQCAAWLPYWEIETSLEDADALGGELELAIAFAAVFDSKDRPLMLPETEELLDELNERYQDTDTRVMLSIVNDVELEEGGYDNKSSDLLRRLFANEESVSKHITHLFHLVDEYHLSGLEIDYENIKGDTDLWARFADFIAKLYERFSAEGLALRVVLSWDAPKYIALPQGPEYSVMCYNLYGYHSGPGPKADLEFLTSTYDHYEGAADNVHMAFATGGFDWHGGEITALTQLQAEILLSNAAVAATRDIASGALYATCYWDGEEHTVWYADGQTLAIWHDSAKERGFANVDLFRLGGNSIADWFQTLLQ